MLYPDVSDYKALLAYIKETNASPEADALSRRMCYGTTSKRSDHQVMFIGEKVALVKRVGYKYQGFYNSGYVMVVSLTEGLSGVLNYVTLGFDGKGARKVWSTDTFPRRTDPNSGRLTGQNLRDLFGKVIEFDKNHDALRGPVLAEKRAKALARREAEAKRLADHEARRAEAKLMTERVRDALIQVGAFTPEEIKRVFVRELREDEIG